jgi:DNA-binding XRE family transcriptional regulator
METVFHDGRECVIVDRRAYEDLLDARDHAHVMRDIATGRPTLSPEELTAYLAAHTPVAYWRKRSGKTQMAIAAEIGVSQPFLAQIEAGKRAGTIGVLSRLAKALGVRIEDLIVE